MDSYLSNDHSELPSDMIFQILTRTSSLETLDACRSVCKAWNKITYESSFMPTYCKRTKNLYGYFIQDMKYNTYRSMFVSLDQNQESTQKNPRIEGLPYNTKILASSDYGLLCCQQPKKNRNYRYYVYKPATGQWPALPNPKLRFQEEATVALMVQPSSSCTSSLNLRYRIIRLSCRGILRPKQEYKKYRCEVFDSKIWKWCELEQDILLPLGEIIHSDPPISAGASIYWLTTDYNILSFTPKNNSFHKFSIPKPLHNLDSAINLLEYEGKLGLAYLTKDKRTELWTMEDRKTNQWTRLMGLSCENLEEVVSYPSVSGFYNGDIAFMKAYGEVAFYKLQDCSFDVVKLDDMIYASEIFPFRSDLEPVNLGGRRRRRNRDAGVCRLSCVVFLFCCLFLVLYYGFLGKLVGWCKVCAV